MKVRNLYYLLFVLAIFLTAPSSSRAEEVSSGQRLLLSSNQIRSDGNSQDWDSDSITARLLKAARVSSFTVVEISGVAFTKPLEWSDYVFPFSIRFKHCAFNSDVRAEYLHVKGSLAFVNFCEFNGLFDFRHATVDDEMDLSDSRFLAKKVSTLDAAHADSAEPVSFRKANIGHDLVLRNVNCFAIELRFCSAGGDLDMRNMVIGKPDIIQGPAPYRVSLAGARIGGSLRLEGVAMSSEFSLSDTTWSKLTPTPSTNSDADFALSLLSNNKVELNTYQQLEDQYRSLGCALAADKVYIARRRFERESANSLERIGNCLLDLSILYGKQTWRSFVVVVFFVVLGTVVLRGRDKVEWVSVNRPEGKYSSFWLSLDLFLPVIQLGSSSDWKVDSHNGPVFTYTKLHTMVGWFLVPFLVGALTGIIK